MTGINISVGRSNFADIRKNGYYYVDKSDLIIELLKTEGTQVTLITRPRRFGKTLGMSMLLEFFDIRKDNQLLFDGLSISENKELCKNWMNQWPTLSLSFKDITGLNFTSAKGMLKFVISNICIEHYYLKDSTRVNEIDKKVFLKLADLAGGEATEEQLKTSIALIMRMMQAHYGKQVILLLDEYDVPLAKASDISQGDKDYYVEMLDIIRVLLSTAIKDNNSLKFAIITGCLKIAKESIFTGTNNFVSDTISNTRLNEYFGFTQKEVDQLLKKTNLVSHSAEIKEWYNGYCFGNSNVYCPWDVMNFVRDLALDSSAKPSGYWKNSSDNAIIRSFIDYAEHTITKKFETLLSGGYIVQPIVEDLTYDFLHSSEDNLWSILYLTGYLTREKKFENDLLPKDHFALIIPNAEIKEIFEDSIKKWFYDCSVKWNRTELFAAIWSQNEERATSEMTKLLRKTISYHDYKEDFYHAFLAGIFAGAGYIVESNKEHGEGRSDVVIQDYTGDRVVIFEAKYSSKLEDLPKDCEKAIAQIDRRKYAEEFMEEYKQVICYGISFYKKRCMIHQKR